MIGTGRIGSNFGWTSGSIDASLLLEQFSFALLLGCGVAKRDGEVDGYVDDLRCPVADFEIERSTFIEGMWQIDVLAIGIFLICGPGSRGKVEFFIGNFHLYWNNLRRGNVDRNTGYGYFNRIFRLYFFALDNENGPDWRGLSSRNPLIRVVCVFCAIAMGTFPLM